MKNLLFKILVLVGCGFWAMSGIAQNPKTTPSRPNGKSPSWIKHIPQPKKSNFYYRVTVAEGSDYTKAYARAFAMALLESSWKHGVSVGKKNDLEALESDIYANINVMPKDVKIPLNKVCEYTESISGTMTGIRIYILWQVGNTSNDSQFEIFTDCE